MSKKLIPLPEAIESETGNRPNPVTCWRWATKGSKGVILETVMLGGRRLTTTDAVRRFIDQRTKVGTTPEISYARKRLNTELGIK